VTTETTEQETRAPEPFGGLGQAARNVFNAENSLLVTFLAVLLAFVVGAILMVVSNTATMSKAGYFFASPGDFLSAAWHNISSGYTALFKGAIFDPATVNGTPAQFFGPITNTLLLATPLIFGGLAVSLAFRAGLFNIGGQGQLIIGAIFAAYVGFAWHLPTGLHLIVAVLAGAFGGMLYGAIVGVLKTWRGAHEVIVTIMLNNTAFALLGYLLNANGFHDPTKFGQAVSKPVDANARLPHLFGDSMSTDIGLIIALAATVAAAWLMSRSKLGFEIRALGINPRAARIAGIDVVRTRITAMALSGLLFGLVGVTQTLGTTNPNNNSLSPNIDAGLGFDAITVALLGRNRPWGIVAAALLFGAFNAGASVMQASAGLPIDIVNVVKAVIVIFVAAPRLVQEIFRLRARRASVATGGQA
jgi:ABC-type uncharacterized transport system permease subunit